MKKQTPERTEQLMRQYPAVRTIHRYNVRKGAEPSRVEVRVQRADMSLMWKRGDNVEGSGRYVLREGGQGGTRHEYAYVVSERHHPWRRMSWSTFDTHHVRDIFNETITFDSVPYIVWVTEYDWYERTEEGDHGPHAEWEVYYTVYLPPDEGFGDLYRRADVTKNVELTERDLITGTLNGERPFELASERLGTFARWFERRVYWQGLGEIIHASRKKGMSGLFDGVTLMSWTMCGRLMMTFEAPNPNDPNLRDSFSIIGNDNKDDARFGWRSICATADRAHELVEAVVNAWSKIAPEDRPKAYRDDREVSLGI